VIGCFARTYSVQTEKPKFGTTWEINTWVRV